MQVEKLEEIKRKPLHGQFLRNMEKAGISKDGEFNHSGAGSGLENKILPKTHIEARREQHMQIVP